jgi:hypothetical protein
MANALLVSLASSGCGSLDVGSNIYWSARYEGGDLGEWKNPTVASIIGSPGMPGSADAGAANPITGGISMGSVSGSMVAASPDVTYLNSKFAAKFSLAGTNNQAQSQSLTISGNLPVEAYYSSWYFIPSSSSVVNIPGNGYWVIMKFRRRDPTDGSMKELYDLNLKNFTGTDGGQLGLTLRLYDWDTGGDDPLTQNQNPAIPVDRWFQIEALYRNGSGNDGHLAIWLDGVQILDKPSGPTAHDPWVAWEVASIGLNLNPSATTLYADDAAISLVRVGPAGRIAN